MCHTKGHYFRCPPLRLRWPLYWRGALTRTDRRGDHTGTRRPIARPSHCDDCGLAHRAQLRMRLNCNNLFLIRIANYFLFIFVYYLHSNYCLVFLINAKYFFVCDN